MDDYNPNWTPNTTDAQHRRYRYGNQPSIAQWNLVQLANALYPLVGAVEPPGGIRELRATFRSQVVTNDGNEAWAHKFKGSKDRDPIEQALAVLQTVETDMTLFWRELAKVNFDSTS